jgi:transcriptional regulator with XRE-family HTH domain
MVQDLSKDKFQKRLQQLIDDKNLKQKDLAKEIDVSTAAISSWLKQKTIPTKKHLSKLSDYFGVTEDYLKGLTDVPASILEENPETGEKKIIKMFPMPVSISAENIGRLLRNLSYKEQEYLYQILNTAKNFDMNEWRSLYIIVRTLWQCRHPHITLFNPLSSFDNFKCLFYNTDIFLKTELDNSEFKVLNDYKTLKTKMADFEGTLEDDFKDIKNIFESVDCLKRSIPHTNQRIEEIINLLKNGQYYKDSNSNKKTQEGYSMRLKKAYETDLNNIVKLFGN